MSPEWLSALARYNRWMNDKLYGRAATLSDEARKRDGGAFFKSIHGTFNHILLADRIWLSRFTGVTVPDGLMGPGGIRSLDQELFVDFEELRRERATTDDELSAWVAELTHERLAAPLVFVRRGQRSESPLWWAVAHVFNHQTHHRGQITTLLTQLGCDPGVTDLVAMLREEATRAPVASGDQQHV
ncbi:MAG: damage-inducible protein DinB [Polyangiaceae bacterium]|nr:damage-inducible protein DinB [Polyangiaceae bacterium]